MTVMLQNMSRRLGQELTCGAFLMTTFTRNSQVKPTAACRRRTVLQALAAGACVLGVPAAAPRTALAATRPLRILHIMSYHAEWQWNRDQFDSFRAELADLDVEYQVIEMDMKRNSGR